MSSRLETKNAGTSKNLPKDTAHAKKDSQSPSRPGPQAGLLYLRVSRGFLNLLPAATAGQTDPQPLPPPPGTIGHLYVIRASLQDLRPFAGGTVDWLIRVARLIFEPLGTSSLFTFTADTLDSWLDRDMDSTQWRQVEQGEQLKATIYEFRPDNNAFITLSRMSLREGTSATTNTSQPQATAFRNMINERDGKCIISQTPWSVAASRLVPKRLSDAAVTSVVRRFTGSDAAVTRFDPTLGVLLFLPLDDRVGSYEVGFWNSGPDQYVIHSFFHAQLSIIGAPPLAPSNPMLHGHTMTLSTHDASFPPIGMFNWHYLQCVLKKFATDEYKQIQNICYFSLPFRTREEVEEAEEIDLDFDDERNIANPPYPSYPIELAEATARLHLEDAERNRDIGAWNSNVSTS
ncbi:hypothetical protein JOM56_010019 [Amanita muscaria]